jgi:patatin-like phospholipase/acyl hydrolase
MKLGISITGGGALGIGPLQFMRRLEADLGKKLAVVGDAFAGTSTGSIVATGLANGMSAEQLYNLYKENLPKIFKKVSPTRILSKSYYRYDNAYLKSMLQANFKKHMYEFKKPVFIPVTFLNGDSVEKVWDRGDGDTEQWFAVLSSCSAPTYFNTVSREWNGETENYCDGGMWANDPVMVLESGLMKNKAFKDNLRILSFNTGMKHPLATLKDKSILGWGQYILDEWIARTGMSSLYMAKANLGKDNVCPVAPEVTKKYEMDNMKIIDEISDIWDKHYDKVGAKVLKFITETPSMK